MLDLKTVNSSNIVITLGLNFDVYIYTTQHTHNLPLKAAS